MSEEANVTFVGGKAVEQHLDAGSSLDADEHAEARAAVKKAIDEANKASEKAEKADKPKPTARKPDDPAPKPTGEPAEKGKQAGHDDAPERGPDGKFLPKKAKAEPDDSDDESDAPEGESDDAEDDGEESKAKEKARKDLDITKASVKELLKNRELAAKLKKPAKEDLSLERQRFEAERLAFQQQQYALAQQQAELRKQAAAFAALRNDPARAVREAGYDPEQFIIDLAQEGTPEGKMARQLRETQEQLRQMQLYQQAQVQQQQQYQQAMAQRAQQQQRYEAVQQFVTLGMKEDKYPHIAAFYKGNERQLVAAGDLTAEEYRQLSGGREGSYEDILDYIEDNLAERFKGWYSKSQKKSVKDESDSEDVKQEKPKSKGKSLSPDTSGERRTLKAKSLKDLDGDERLEAAKQAVAVALANSGKK